jgi:hypothetical protein
MALLCARRPSPSSGSVFVFEDIIEDEVFDDDPNCNPLLMVLLMIHFIYLFLSLL